MWASSYADGDGTLGAHMLGKGAGEDLSATRRGILFAPGGGGLETSWQVDSPTNPNVIGALLRALAGDQYRRFLSFPTNWDWANPTVVTRGQGAWATAKARYGFATDKVHLIGASMGGACMANLARTMLSEVASISMVIPVVDLQDIEDNDRVVPYSLPEPRTAYGGNRPPDADNPADNAAALSGVPIKIWYSSNDSVCIPATITAFAAASGAEAVSLGPQSPPGYAIPGHAAGNLPIDDVAAFIAAHDD